MAYDFTYRRSLSLGLGALFLLTTATSDAQSTPYVWASYDDYPDGLSGTIVLNSPSYSGDFDESRIVSVTLSDTASGTYHVDWPRDLYASGAIMEWGPAGISEMVLGLSRGAPASSWFLIADQNDLYGFNPCYPASIREIGVAEDYSGAWVVVPEPSSLCLLFLAATLKLPDRYRVWLRGAAID